MKIIYLGGKQAGCIGLLTLLALNHEILVVKAYDDKVDSLARELHLKTYSEGSLKVIVHPFLYAADLLVSVHGRDIVAADILDQIYYGGINVHPCLYAYKGVDPIQRFLADNESRASVGVHRMTPDVDMGETIVEEFVDIVGKQTVEEVYNDLYPLYAVALIKALQKIKEDENY